VDQQQNPQAGADSAEHAANFAEVLNMNKRSLVSSGSPFEPKIGFSRAVRAGNFIAVSGTAPVLDGKTACPGDVYGQTKRCLEIIEKAVQDAGGTMKHVVRTRLFLADMDQWQEAAMAHGEVFGEIRPASTFVEISRLIDKDWLIEIEADAVVTD
jgi:enamine deaminase RidA (YjgF/YER057c/UK114 family)